MYRFRLFGLEKVREVDGEKQSLLEHERKLFAQAVLFQGSSATVKVPVFARC